MSAAAAELFSNLADAAEGGRAPASVTALDLPRLANLVGCSVAELTGGLAAERSLLHASGRVASQKEEVAFEAETPPPPTRRSTATSPPAIPTHTVLLSVASRPSVLDTAQTPKVLMNLAGEPVLALVLSQLATAGVRRAVIVLGARGAPIRAAIDAHPISKRLRVECGLARPRMTSHGLP